MNPEVFVELSLILVITVLVTAIIKALKQPAVIGYLLSGILAGPVVFDIITSKETFETFSHIGVALLLFFVGLNLNPHVIKEVGKVSLLTGVGQVLFTSTVGFFLAKGLGFSSVAALYISIALAFSSTIVIMKLLSDKRDLESLYGRISIGFLIVQDFIAIIILLALSSFGKGENLSVVAIETFALGILGIVALFLVTHYVLPHITKRIAKSQEFLLLFSIGWCFSIATVFHYLNFSIEAGALLAGIALSMSAYHYEISSKMKPIRDFFLILFFVMLGSQMVFSNILEHVSSILVFSLFVLIGNPLIVMTLMGLLGYTKKNSFQAGLTVAQISEFSLIIVAIGVSMDQLSLEVLSVITAVGLITFAGSTYMILYSEQLFKFLSVYLSVFERRHHLEEKKRSTDSHELILFGYNRTGYHILESLKKLQKKFVIVDYDPSVIKKLVAQGYDAKYGDANSLDLLDELNLSHAKMIISTISLVDTNLLIIRKVRQVNKDAIVSIVSHQIDDALTLYEEGATYVILPHFLGGKYFSTMIEENQLSTEKFLRDKILHLEDIYAQTHRKYS